MGVSLYVHVCAWERLRAQKSQHLKNEMSVERNPFIAKNQTLYGVYRIYICFSEQGSSTDIQLESQ